MSLIMECSSDIRWSCDIYVISRIGMKIMRRVYVFTNANDVLHSDVSRGRMANLRSSGGASFMSSKRSRTTSLASIA